MTQTTNLKLTYVEIGQKEKSVTINTNFDLLDSLPTYLGEHASAPATVEVAAGSTYYNSTTLKLNFLKSNDVWTEI